MPGVGVVARQPKGNCCDRIQGCGSRIWKGWRLSLGWGSPSPTPSLSPLFTFYSSAACRSEARLGSPLVAGCRGGRCDRAQGGVASQGVKVERECRFDASLLFHSSLFSAPYTPRPSLSLKMGRKRDQPAAHRHGLAEDMANPWKNGIRVSEEEARENLAAPARRAAQPRPGLSLPAPTCAGLAGWAQGTEHVRGVGRLSRVQRAHDFFPSRRCRRALAVGRRRLCACGARDLRVLPSFSRAR